MKYPKYTEFIRVMVPAYMKERICQLADDKRLSQGDICRWAVDMGLPHVARRGRLDQPSGPKDTSLTFMVEPNVRERFDELSPRSLGVVVRSVLNGGLRMVDRP